MKVAILTDVIDRSVRGTGVPSYGKYLIDAMIELAEGIEIYLIHYQKDDCFIYSKGKEIIIKPPVIWLPRLLSRTFIILFKLPRVLKREDIGVIHILAPTFFEAPVFLLPYLMKIITFHDIHQCVIKRKFEFSLGHFKCILRETLQKYLFRFLVNRADKIITVSFNTKNDLIKALKVPEHKIVAIHSATDKKVEKKDLPMPPSRLVNGRYIVSFPPSFELLDIFNDLRKKKKGYKLVIFGYFGKTFTEKLKNYSKKYNMEKQVILTGYISTQELITLYSNADLLINYSDYEGFGLPPLEAMSCGCPVVASNRASVPEVVGEGGILLQPNNKKEWVDAIYKILSDEKLREELSEKGRNQAKKFSWEKTACQTIKVYEEVVRKKFIASQ